MTDRTQKRESEEWKKRTYEGCKWKTEIMQEKEKNAYKIEKMIKGEYIREGISLSTRKTHNITYNNTSTEQVTHLDVKQNVPGRVNKKPQG